MTAAQRPDTPLWVEAVTPAEIVHQRALGWPDFHPEDFCHQCGRRNPVWWVDSPAWNRATAELQWNRAAILCPSCFCTAWERATGLQVIWEVRLDPASRALREAGDPQ